MILYPEHEKLQAVQEVSQSIGEFITWLSEQGTQLMIFKEHHWWSEPRTIERMLAEFFEIDLNKIETEKREMLESIRRATGS